MIDTHSNPFNVYMRRMPARHQTLGMSFREPSEGMKAWIDADNRWHADQTELSLGTGGDAVAATSYADLEAKRRLP